MNFVLYIGHLGRRELSGATGSSEERRVALYEAHHNDAYGSDDDGRDDGG